jgi:CheY-like chemotaxis protein
VNARPGRYVALRVRDTGTGIAPEILEKLFVPFVTTKPARSGTGLGLAVVYGIVASHHGFVDVASELGKGAVFEVFLPMSERRMDAAASEPPAASFARGQGTILVVDDEPQVREVITRILTGCGYSVITAADGSDALGRYGTGAGIDLVILDMVMPGMGGRECLKRMREANPLARVLIATGYTSDGSSRELLGAGAAGIVEKPLQLPGFAETVRAAMGEAGRIC